MLPSENKDYYYYYFIPNCSGENGEFIGFANFSDGSHLEFSTRLNFTILKSWSLIMLHMKLQIHGCSDLRELAIQMDLNARVHVNCGQKHGLTDGKPDAYITPC